MHIFSDFFDFDYVLPDTVVQIKFETGNEGFFTTKWD
jgi:hypothetical protein